MGTVIKELAYFCPINDTITMEAIVAEIEMKMQIELLMKNRMECTSDDW